MNPSFHKWQKEVRRLLVALKGLLEEELQSLLLPAPHLFHDIQKRKNTLLQAYAHCILEGKIYENFLKELSQEQKELWVQEMKELQYLASRNIKVTQQFIKDMQHSFASFHQWLKQPSLQSPYHFNHKLSLGLDRRM